MLESAINKGEIWNIPIVQFLQHTLFNQLRNHIIGGYHHIVVRAAAFQQRVQRLITLHCLVIHPDACFLFKLGNQLRVNILAPAAHIDHWPGAGSSC